MGRYDDLHVDIKGGSGEIRTLENMCRVTGKVAAAYDEDDIFAKSDDLVPFMETLLEAGREGDIPLMAVAARELGWFRTAAVCVVRAVCEAKANGRSCPELDQLAVAFNTYSKRIYSYDAVADKRV